MVMAASMHVGLLGPIEIDLQEVSGQPLIPPITFLVNEGGPPIPASKTIQVVTGSSTALTWTVTISPSVPWLSVTPPISGQISSTVSDQFTLVASQPITHGVYTTTLVVTGTAVSGEYVSPVTNEVHISSVSELKTYYFPIMFKN